MKTVLALAAILATSVASTSKEPIRPHVVANNNEETTGEFLNGIQAQCPKGMKAVDVHHLLVNDMSYQQAFNALASVECQP